MRNTLLCFMFLGTVFLTACNAGTARFLNCVIDHESRREPDPAVAVNHAGSSASGLFQFLDSTWRSLSNRYGVQGYARAKDAPGYVQTYVAYRATEDGGKGHWRGSNC